MTVKPIPDGFHTVTPYLVVKGVPQLIEFLEKGIATHKQDLQGSGTTTPA